MENDDWDAEDNGKSADPEEHLAIAAAGGYGGADSPPTKRVRFEDALAAVESRHNTLHDFKHCKILRLFLAGTVFDEIVVARDYEHARNVALARNPGCTIVSVTAVF